MELMHSIRVLIVVIAPLVRSQEIKVEAYKHGTDICKRLIKEPFFDTNMVVGKPWRIYFTWNMKMEDKCLDMVFKNVTSRKVNRVYNDMYEYLEDQPLWVAATLLVTMGQAGHEILLFADQGAAGQFIGVPNIVREGIKLPAKKSVPLLKYHMKLLLNGRYLVMSNCHIGVTTLSARRKPVPQSAELGSIASKLDYGEGFQACKTERGPKEQAGMK